MNTARENETRSENASSCSKEPESVHSHHTVYYGRTLALGCQSVKFTPGGYLHF